MFDGVLFEEGTRATDGEEKDRRRTRTALGAGTSSSAFPFASAAQDAANSARKSHLDGETAIDRRRLEREAFRVSVHEHVRKELVKASVEATSALAAMANAE